MSGREMTADTLPELHADQIAWDLQPIARLEDMSSDTLVTLNPVELLTYVADCREDLRAVRVVLAEALALVARQQDQLTRAAQTIESQRREMRQWAA